MLSFGSVWALLYWYLRPIVKWFLHKTTGLCELQRICYGARPGTQRIRAVEYSLELSKSNEIKAIIQKTNGYCSHHTIDNTNRRVIFDEILYTVTTVKRINLDIHAPFVVSFSKCLEQIWGYRQLYFEVEQLRTTQYDCDDLDHESKLSELWDLLVPDVKLESRITKQWQHIGFQGDDPKTDFRGMGLLGLENLLYFAREYSGPSKHVLSHSLHPQYGYTFAIVGINLTSMAYRLLKEGTAKTHMYNASKSWPSMKLFHQLYCYLFYEFDRHWVESKPKSIMDFSFIQERFENRIRQSLADPATVFRIKVSVDNI